MNRLALLTLPLEVQEAFQTLERHGVDFEKLIALVCKRKRGRPRKAKRIRARGAKRGAPSLLPFTMQDLSDFVDACKEEGKATTDAGAIRELVKLEATYQCCTAWTLAASFPYRGVYTLSPEKLVRSLQQRLSRHRKASSNPLHNSR